MAAISQKIVNLIGGVSQQPDSIKFNNQVRECGNFYPDVALGLTKRPGLKGIRKLNNVVDGGSWFSIFRDDQEKYLVQFSKAGALKIWSASNGIQQTVNGVAAEAIAYAAHSNSDDLELLQVNDYTFVLNRNQIVSMTNTTSAAIDPYAFVSIATIAYESTYTITLDADEFAYTTPATANQLNINDIVSNLVNTINAFVDQQSNAVYEATGIGSYIHIKRADNDDFSIIARGGNAGTSIEAFKGSVTAPGQLPKQFLNNLKIKVGGSNNTGADDYWVVFKTSNNSSSGVGAWIETIAPNITTNINEETMPHAIIREANGTFTYRKLDSASASASGGTTAVTGIPTVVTIVTALSGGHIINEEFDVNGGSGTNLRLKVTKTKEITTTSSYGASSNTYVQQINGYRWFENSIQIGQTNKPTLTIGNKVYTVNGAFQNLSNTKRAGLTITTQLEGVIDGVTILQAGQGYTVSNIVTNSVGDSFQVTSSSTVNLEGDAFRLNFWQPRAVGDLTTNPSPSFINNNIDAIAFHRNRLVFTSRQNVICSRAGDYFNFFAETVITIVDSDPIDISANTLKPIKLKYTLPSPRGLVLFGNDAQYILETTTESFSPKTAELNRISALSQSDRIAPIDIGPGVLFSEEGIKASSIYEMNLGDAGGNKTMVTELTRLVPSYIPSGLVRMKASQSAGLVALLSANEPNVFYLYRFFQNGNERIASWFKWVLAANIETFDFDHDTMYIVTKLQNNYVLSTISLLTETASESLKFDNKYIDVRLDLFDYNPKLTYDATTDTTHVCFKDGFEDTSVGKQGTIVYLDPDVAGFFEKKLLTEDLTKPVGERYFVIISGNQTSSRFALGYSYNADLLLPSFYVVKDEARALKDTVNIPTIHRIYIDSYNSGPYSALIIYNRGSDPQADTRDAINLDLPQINASQYLANNIPMTRNAQSIIPIFAKGTDFQLGLFADSPFPTAFTSITWEGTYNTKGIKSL